MIDDLRSYPNSVQGMLDRHREKYARANLVALQQQIVGLIREIHNPERTDYSASVDGTRQAMLLYHSLQARESELQHDETSFAQRVREAEKYQVEAA